MIHSRTLPFRRISRLLLLVGAMAVAGLILTERRDAQAQLERVNQYCTRTLGFEYGLHAPPTHVPFRPEARAKHSAGLIRLMQEVDQNLARNARNYDQILSRLEDNLAEDPSDSIRLFKVGYAFTQAIRLAAEQGGSFWWEGSNRQWGALLSRMVTAPASSPNWVRADEASFEWLRVRFILQEGVFGPRELIPLGRWLLSQSQEDFALQRSLAGLLGDGPGDSETKEAIAICQDALRSPVARSSWYSLKSYAYTTRWLRMGHKRRDLEEAILATEAALRELPPNGRSKPHLEYLLKGLMRCRAQSH